MLAGSHYLAEAKNNRTREYKVIAPRGEILDRNGNLLVDNRTSLALQLNTANCPKTRPAAKAELTQLGRPRRTCRCARCGETIPEQEEVAAGAPVTLRQDVGYDLVYYLEENQRRFPGVTRRSGSSSATTRTAAAPPTCSAASARSPKKS